MKEKLLIKRPCLKELEDNHLAFYTSADIVLNIIRHHPKMCVGISFIIRVVFVGIY